MRLRFRKMQGLGNDFLVVDRRADGTPVAAADAIRLCRRRLGVGADGVLSLLPSTAAPLAMHVTNADGSEAEMCGNGLRCVVRYATEVGLLPPSGGVVETGRGLLSCVVEADGQIRVDMGAPVLDPSLIPVHAHGDRFVEHALEVGDGPLQITAVSMGNPHAVTFVEGDTDLFALARVHGPAIERHPLFPRRTNVEFARVRSAHAIDLVVWERGSGLTQACGTGACATVVAAVLTGRAPVGEDVIVHLPGGPLRVRIEPDFSRVWMTGPAETVFDGEAF